MTRGELEPDPEQDPIQSLFFAISETENEVYQSGFIWVGEEISPLGFDIKVIVGTEEEALDALVKVVARFDPDVLVGYDVQRGSWGYVADRARALRNELCPLLSRFPHREKGSAFSNEEHWWALTGLEIEGRIAINLWRILRHDIALRSYTFENVLYHLLGSREPHYPFRILSLWAKNSRFIGRLVDYYRCRVVGSLDLMRRCNVVNRTTEMAKYGMQFYEVLSRGSQFRVESMMLRITRTRNFIAISPSPEQRSKMASPKVIALTMEPFSKFYSDPVVVVDFQSLYPSICIAYNYCYSTCIGKIQRLLDLPESIEFGCSNLRVDYEKLGLLKGAVHVSPAGVGFLSKGVRRGVIPSMLEEILDTRVLVKKIMKDTDKESEQRIQDARQLALKLIANVTFGYTSANFSGRMPCVEIADSIVHKARETLEAAAELVNSRPDWRAEVVYGDTDSLFIHLPGRTKLEAFALGQEIADTITNTNPAPMKLKFEKVYQPCFLQTKKRYAGWSFETPEQEEGTFDAKGIETVRRDGCPLASSILETSLKILFENEGNLLPVKSYLSHQVSKILSGRLSLANFIIARQFRGRQGYKEKSYVPALKIAKSRFKLCSAEGAEFDIN